MDEYQAEHIAGTVTDLIHRQDRFRASLPARYRRASMADLPTARREALTGWLGAGHPWCLVLTGAPGRGKTYAACALGLAHVWQGGEAKFENWPAHVAADPFGKQDSGWLGLDGFEGLLILDDIGAGRVSDFTVARLYTVIDQRESNLRPTVFTTNASLDELGALDGRLGSRLSGARWLAFQGEDLRPAARPPEPLPPIAPWPTCTADVAAEAARQELSGFDAELFCKASRPCRQWLFPQDTGLAEKIPHPDAEWSQHDWRRWLRPWHEALQKAAKEA